ncbi:MAG TPA: serine hydrolase [Vicinamibacteria bacterium]|nr:serine hydrolase [Vicinamibacteria bacterium]
MKARPPLALAFALLSLPALASAASLSPAAAPAAAADVAGHWEGPIQLPGTELKVLVDLKAGAAGGLEGTIDIPAQGAKGLPLEALEVTDRAVSFAIRGIPGQPTFKGTLSADGVSIEGSFTQGGQTFPFRLSRGAEPAKAAAQALDGFSDWVRKTMADWKVPGLAVAVVKNGEVVLQEGYGVRDVASGAPVTPDTLFAIGSATKAFTATALALLVDDGKVNWDTPVRAYLPAFKLKDPVASERMTPRDLVTHRSGLPRHDLVWYASPLSRKELVSRLEFLEPSADFRSRWQYQNLMFMTAGYLAGEVAGMPWEDLVRARIFAPLGMKGSNFSVEESKRSADFAKPYQEKDEKVLEIPFRNIDAVGPAGAVNSSVRDMSRWLLLQLGGGKVGDTTVLTGPGLAELHKPQMVVGESGQDPEVTGTSYAMGWFVESYRGHLRVQHGGAIDGFIAMVTFLPREGIGVVALANLGGTGLPEVVARQAIDRLLGLPPIDWSARLLQRREAGRKAEKAGKAKGAGERKPGTRPAHALDEYAGDYEHPAYGVVSVSRASAPAPAAPPKAPKVNPQLPPPVLAATFHGIPMALEHWHYETWKATPTDPAMSDETLFVQFHDSVGGEVDRLTVNLEPAASEIAFTKKAPARLSDPAFLGGLTGVYTMADNPSFTITIDLKGTALTAFVPGQPIYDLVPYRGTEFRLKQVTGFAIRFALDEKGVVREALLIQPNAVFTIRRK